MRRGGVVEGVAGGVVDEGALGQEGRHVGGCSRRYRGIGEFGKRVAMVESRAVVKLESCFSIR